MACLDVCCSKKSARTLRARPCADTARKPKVAVNPRIAASDLADADDPQVLAALGRKVGAADATKVTDKLLDDRGRKKLAELIAGGDRPPVTGGALSR